MCPSPWAILSNIGIQLPGLVQSCNFMHETCMLQVHQFSMHVLQKKTPKKTLKLYGVHEKVTASDVYKLVVQAGCTCSTL